MGRLLAFIDKATAKVDCQANCQAREAVMRHQFHALGALFILIAMAANTTVANAQNYPWCGHIDAGSDDAVNCGFVSYEQCMATIRGEGGYCEANTLYQPTVPAPHSTARGRDHS
jgi:hypothetical protein